MSKERDLWNNSYKLIKVAYPNKSFEINKNKSLDFWNNAKVEYSVESEFYTCINEHIETLNQQWPFLHRLLRIKLLRNFVTR